MNAVIATFRGVAAVIALLSVVAVALVTYGPARAAVGLEETALIRAIPWLFGVAGIINLVAAFVVVRLILRESKQLSDAVAGAESWDALCADPGAATAIGTWLPSVERRLQRGLRPNLDAVVDGQRTRASPDGLHSTIVAALIVVGIVFTFMGVKDSAVKLRGALVESATTPTSAIGVAVPDPGSRSARLQQLISEALQPLEDSFGANLVGIVLAIVLMLAGAWLRHERRMALAALEHAFYDELEPLLDAKYEEIHRAPARENWQLLVDRLGAIQDQHRSQHTESAAHLTTAANALVLIVSQLKNEEKSAGERLESLDATLQGLAEHLAQRLTDQLAPVLHKQLEPSLAALAAALERIASQTSGTAQEAASAAAAGVASSVRASYDEAIQQLAGVIRELQDWSSANRDALHSTGESLRQAALEQQSSFRLASTAFDGLRQVLPSLSDIVVRLDGIVGATHQLVAQNAEGAKTAAGRQMEAASALATSSESVQASLIALQGMPAAITAVVEQSGLRLEGVIAKADMDAQVRIQGIQAVLAQQAAQQQQQAAAAQQALAEFRAGLESAVGKALEAARAGLGGVSKQAAEELAKIAAASGAAASASADGIEAVVAQGISDLQSAFVRWSTGMSTTAAAIQSQSQAQAQRMASALTALEQLASAVKLSSDSVAGLPNRVGAELTKVGEDFRKAVATALGGMHNGVDQELAKAVGLLASGTLNLEAAIRKLQATAQALQATAQQQAVERAAT